MSNFSSNTQMKQNMLDHNAKMSRNDSETTLEFNILVDTPNNGHNSEKYTIQNIEEFFNLLENQSDEIKSLRNQNAILIQIIQKNLALNSKSEDIIESLNQQIYDLDQENSDIKKNILEIEKLDQKDNDNLNDIYNLLLKQAPLEVLQKINKVRRTERQDSIYQDMTQSSKEIVDLFDELCAQYSISKKSFQREKSLLGHLKNALYFINSIINSNSLQNASIDKSLVMTQIARINLFIGQNYGIEEINPIVSIFQHNKPEDQIKTINSFLDKQESNQNGESKNALANESIYLPFNELYTLFYGVLELNNLLFSQLDLVNQNVLNTASGASLKKKVHDLENENHKLSAFYDNVNSKLDNISNLISGKLVDPSSDIFDMILDLIGKYESFINQPLLSANQGSLTIASVSQLSSAEINQNANSLSDSNLIRNDSDEIINSNDNKQIIPILISQNKQSIVKINILKAMIRKLKKTIAIEKKKLKDFKNSSNSQIDQLKAELLKKNKISSHLNKLIKQNKELALAIKVLTEQNNKLQEQQQDKLYQQQDDLANESNQQIKQRNIKTLYVQAQTQTIDQNFDEIIMKLQQQISSLEGKHSELLSQVSSLTKTKDDLLVQNTKFKVSERMLKLKISQMEEFIRFKDEQSLTQSKIRDITMNSQKDSKIQDLTEQLKNHELLLKSIVESYFPDIQITKDTNYSEIISNLEQVIINSNLYFSQETLKDADIIRKQLNLKKSDSLYDAFNQIKNKLDQQNEFLQNLNEEKIAYSNGIKEARINSDKINNLELKLDEWNKWAISIYTQITGVVSSTLSSSNIRHDLEEILISTIGQSTLMNKIGILRSEKILLYKFYDEISNSQISSASLNSLQVRKIKPLIFIFLFTRKLQNLTSCMSISYIPFTINQPKLNREVPNSQDSVKT